MPESLRPSGRKAVLVAVVNSEAASVTSDAFAPNGEHGRSFLKMAGRSEYPPNGQLQRITLKVPRRTYGPDKKEYDDIILAEEARKLAETIGDKDVVVVGRQLGDAFGVPRSTPIITWWPSWVVGKGRFVLVLPDPKQGRSKTHGEKMLAIREVLDDLWGNA